MPTRKKAATPTTETETALATIQKGQVYHPEIVTSEQTALSSTVATLIAMTKSDAALKRALKDENSKTILTGTLTTFVAVDCQFDGGMRRMGEVCSNILARDKDIQIAAIKALCDAQNIPMIEYNERAPRTSLARALFARFPDMQEMVQGGKDTKGALRVTSYITAYKHAQAGTTPNRRRLVGATTPDPNAGDTETETTLVGGIKTPKELFQRLWLAGTLVERNTLSGLAGRLGIQYEQWITGTEQPAPAPTV